MDELYYIKLNSLPKPIRKMRFKELQTIAFSRGIGWIGIGCCFQDDGQSVYVNGEIEICLNHVKGIRGKHQFLAYGSNDNLISYRDIIKKLREL